MTSVVRNPVRASWSIAQHIEHGIALLKSQGINPTELTVSPTVMRELTEYCGERPWTFMGLEVWEAPFDHGYTIE